MDGDTNPVEDTRLRPAFLRAVTDALEAGDDAAARTLVEPLHPADLADLFQQLDRDQRAPLAIALGDRLDADVLAEMNDWVRDDVLDVIAPATLADAVAELDTDDAVSIIEDMDADAAQAVLDELDPADRVAIETALTYPEESAGRLMQRELIAVPEHMTVADVLARLATSEITDFWEIFVVSPTMRPVGTMRLSWLLTTPGHLPVSDVMQREQTLIPVDMDQEEVARRFQKYALISAAVTDPGGRLVGVITVDDVVHIIQEEAGEDVLKLSGAGDGDINEPVLDSWRARVRWLVANLGTAVISSSVIASFEPTIERMVALAALTPIVASIGGNAATQTMAVAVRAIATDQLTEANTWRTVRREVQVALLNGLTVAALLGIAVSLLFSHAALGAVIAAAVLFNIIVAGLAGVLVPVALRRFGADPAVASSVFVTMTTDTMGFLIFLSLATATGLTAA